MPNTFDTQQPSRKNKKSNQYQPFKPQGFNIPMGVIGLEARKKRFQNISPKEIVKKLAAKSNNARVPTIASLG
jgi:hypothetical protein